MKIRLTMQVEAYVGIESRGWEEVSPVECELIEFWRKFQEFRPSKEELELKCANAVIDYWDDRGIDIDIDQLERSVTKMMLIIFSLELAEGRSEPIKKKIEERQKEIRIINDTDSKANKNEFWMGVVMLLDGRMELWFDIGMLIDEMESTAGVFDQLPRVSDQLTNKEIVLLGTHAWEEYAHMGFNVYKNGKARRIDTKNLIRLRKKIKREKDPEIKEMLYHVQGMEFRGGVWKSAFMRYNFPSYPTNWVKVVREAGKYRREHHVWP